MIYLIPIAYIQEQCLLSNNIDTKKFTVALEMAQEDLQDTLGKEFYEQIETQCDTDTLSTDNNAVYDDYIKKYLAWQANYHFLGHAQDDSTPTGFREHKDDNSDLISDVKLFSKEKKTLERANKCKYRMINFITLEQSKDSTKYPLYTKSCKVEMSFAISAIDKDGQADALFRVNKSITNNE